MAFMRMPAFIGKAKDGIIKKKAHEELMRYKKLLDEEILTQEEFDLKKDELKKVLLIEKVDTINVHPNAEEVSNTGNKDISGGQPVNIADDKNYEKAIREIEEDNLHKPSWARAISETEGDKAKAEALYIKLRVAGLNDELRIHEAERLKQELLARELQEAERLKQELLARKLQEAEDRKSIAYKEKREKAMKILKGRWLSLVRKYESTLFVYNLDIYLYEVAMLPEGDRDQYAKWLENNKDDRISQILTQNPANAKLGSYGVALIVALERGINVYEVIKLGRS